MGNRRSKAKIEVAKAASTTAEDKTAIKSHSIEDSELPKNSPGWKYPKTDVRHLYALNKQPMGKGSFGLVLKAKHRVTGELYAVKIVDKGRHKNLDVQELFNAEVDVMTQLDHPHILKFFARYEDPKFCYAVFELCTGGELFDEINRLAYFTEYDAVKLVKQMLSAVNYVHTRGYVHRDLKAENFMFKNQYEDSPMVMIDFGLASKYTPGEKLTTLCGSPRYIAPEVLKRCYDKRCDMWSIGVIVYLMLYGSHPFAGWQGATFEQITDEVLNARIDFTSYEGVEAPSEKAQNFLESLLNRDPEGRLDAAQALRHPWLKGTRDELSKSVVDPSVRSMAQNVVTHERKVDKPEEVERKLKDLEKMESRV